MKYTNNIISVILISICTANVIAFDETYTPPGNIYLMFGAFRLYIHCEGEGKTPVIIEAGIGDTLANWLPIQKELSKHTKVCVYDRAGNGLSDPGPGPRTVAQITYELYNLLEKEKLHGPYILMGHSFGGYVAQYFARVFPEKTSGIILVDSSHPDQITRLSDLNKMENQPKRSIGGYKFEDLDLLTPEQRYWKHLNAQRKSVWTQMDELDGFKESAIQLSKVDKPFPTIPVAVLTRGIAQLPIIEGNKSMEKEWQEMQKDLTTLSKQSWQVIAKNSGHSIHQESPETIIENTIKMIELTSKN